MPRIVKKIDSPELPARELQGLCTMLADGHVPGDIAGFEFKSGLPDYLARTPMPGWQARLLPWIASGAPARLQQSGDGRPKGTMGGDSWWTGHTLLLNPDPSYGPLDWLYMTAHFGLSQVPDKHKPDFGIMDAYATKARNAEAWRVEQLARVHTVGWAVAAGAAPSNLLPVLRAWRALPSLVAIGAGAPFKEDDVMDALLRETKQFMVRAADRGRREGTPKPPPLWLDVAVQGKEWRIR